MEYKRCLIFLESNNHDNIFLLRFLLCKLKWFFVLYIKIKFYLDFRIIAMRDW